VIDGSGSLDANTAANEEAVDTDEIYFTTDDVSR
jgi:hypothetical protein